MRQRFLIKKRNYKKSSLAKKKKGSFSKNREKPEMPAVKTGSSYDYLFNSSRMAIEKSLTEPAETKNDSPSLIITAPQIGEKTIPSIETNSVSETSPTLATPAEVPKTIYAKRLLRLASSQEESEQGRSRHPFSRR